MKTVKNPFPTHNSSHREARLNTIISRVLSIGLALAIGLLMVGVFLTVARPELDVARESFIKGIPRAITGLEPDGFFQAGLLILLATPAARVAALLYSYTRSRQWLFAGMSAFVIAVLVTSAYVGLELV